MEIVPRVHYQGSYATDGDLSQAEAIVIFRVVDNDIIIRYNDM